ncbi:MAG: 16S rRNA (cytidine(1402)-2'-O)-methyltransferase [Chloroflexi bacterium RBG_13_53_26]|nr:MAG: 16S rRNA (cytidine(1402)-2'-O)-methyltransferase [Chloroflexi bacterium RBG_13_53_26]
MYRDIGRTASLVPALYVVATPIGNLEDITLRAIRVLNEVGLIAAEDTRRTRVLLNAYGIKTALTSYHQHNRKTKLGYLLDCLQSRDLALVSEAGMPGVSDPGYELIVAAAQQGIRVIPIPGPSAVVTALAVSALPTNRFTYLGFLPKKKAERIRFLGSIAHEQGTIVAFESPHRLLSSLSDMAQVLGNRRIAIARELTKIHEEIFRGTVEEAMEHFRQPRGEFTLVIEGRKEEAEESLLTPKIEKELRSLIDEGIAAKEIVARLSPTTGLSRKELYRACLKLKSNRGL